MSDRSFEHVAHILREKYEFDGQGKSNLNPLIAADLRNAIKHLSQKLYKRTAHFIFELIQNAEDNSYSEQTEPSLTFRLLQNDPTNTSGANGALIVENNETGFTRENFDAICAIGRSTKTNQPGFIGEKGIGFKSVFLVTSRPFLFSNGYQISLPENHIETGLGYIVPEWEKHVPNCIDKSLTSIVLPLDKPDFGYGEVKKMLEDIEPETIRQIDKILNEHETIPQRPERPVMNRERYLEQFDEERRTATKKQRKTRKRRIRISRGTIDPRTWLREQYTNDDAQMVCQICKKEMPFMNRKGKHYFKAVEMLSEKYFSDEHQEQYLALCPLCAAKYKEFIKYLKTNPTPEQNKLKETILNSDDNSNVEILLKDEKASIFFVEKHYLTIKHILES